MPVAEKTMQREAVAADDVKPRKFVHPDKYYIVTLQLGSKARWCPGQRMYAGQDRKVVSTGPSPNDNRYDHVPVVVTTEESFTGSVVNGLIQGHNEWIEKYQRREEFGKPDRQLLVLDVKETDKLPKGHDSAIQNGLVPIHLVHSMVEKAIEELTASSGK